MKTSYTGTLLGRLYRFYLYSCLKDPGECPKRKVRTMTDSRKEFVMKGAIRSSRLKVLGALSSLVLTSVACSSSAEKESSELDVTAAAETEATDEATREATAGSEEKAEAAPAEEAAPAAAAAAATAEATPAPAPAPQPVAAPVEVNKNRVVRYVKAKEAIVRGGPTDQSPEKGRLKKGDTVVVEEQGDWSKVNDESFIKTSELSKKPVKRQREKASWKN